MPKSVDHTFLLLYDTRMSDSLPSLTGLAQVFDLLVAHADDILKYAPIAISLVALYYSRRALHFQISLKCREHIAVVNLVTGRIPPGDPGIEIRNPAKAPLLFAEGWYHHRYLGTQSFTLDLSDGNAICYRSMIKFDGISRGLGPLPRRRRKTEFNRSSIGSLVQPFYQRVLNRRYRVRRPAKVSHGRVAIAEAFITDGSRQTWYVNSNGAKVYWPSGVLSRTVYELLVRLRLLGYPFWSRFSLWNCVFLAILGLDIALFCDRFFNGGALLRYFFDKYG